VDQESLENLQVGLDEALYRWTTERRRPPRLLTEQAAPAHKSKFSRSRKRELTAGKQVKVKAQFAPLEIVAVFQPMSR